MNSRIYQFSEIDQFLKHYSPISPYGKKKKGENIFFTEIEPLNQIYDFIEKMTDFVEMYPEKTDKIEYHLNRIPLLSDLINRANIRSELFNVKKFLHNYKEIFLLLKPEQSFSFEFESESLLNLLGHGEDQEENFYLKDSYSPELGTIRKEIRKVDKELNVLREHRIEQIRDSLQLDFRFHDFLIIKESEMPANTDSFIFRESYDKQFILVKPIWGQEYYDIHNNRKELLHKEREQELHILDFLKNKINAEKDIIKDYIKKLTSLDTILAKTKLANRYQCVRPRIKKDDSISIEKLNFIPLKNKCESFQRKYTPLTADFKKRNIVITGSNMGGKTVLLKSIAFCQLLVQMGFFIPAKEVRTSLFDSLNLIGNNPGGSSDGLSSFGEEVMNMIETDLSQRSLLFFDEFAKTTNSIESYALNSALLEWFAGQTSLYSFSSTHLDNLPVLDNVSYWTMKGLDYIKYSQYYHKNYNGDLTERINLINEFMDYSVGPQNNKDSRKDALKIADILGLNSVIINNAKKYIKNQEINNG